MVPPTPALYQTPLLGGIYHTLQFRDSCQAWLCNSLPGILASGLNTSHPKVSRICSLVLAVLPVTLYLTAQFSNPSQNLGPQISSLCSWALKQTDPVSKDQKGWSWRVLKGNGFCLPPPRPSQLLQAPSLPPRNHLPSQLHSTSLFRNLKPISVVSLNFRFIHAHIPIRIS